MSPRDVQFSPNSLADKLASVPFIGLFVQVWFTDQLVAQREAMFELLDERLRLLESQFRELDGCSSTRVDADAAARVVAEYWHGGALDETDFSRSLRSRPIVGGPGR